MDKNLDIIAEIAQGYVGNVALCKKFIEVASNANATSIKFQLVYADELSTKDYKHYKLFKSLEINDKDWKILNSVSKKNNIKMYFDIFGTKSLKLAEKLKVDTVKIHPTDLTNYPFLKKVSVSKINNIILGVGGYKLKFIQEAVDLFSTKKITLMHGFQGYPTLNKENHLNRIDFFKKKFQKKNIQFAFADHSVPEKKNDYLPSILAIAKGIKVIEKHLTLSKILKMEDYESAYNPDEFYSYVQMIHDTISILGAEHISKNNFKLSRKENNYLKNISRQYVFKKNIKKNTLLNSDMFFLKRTSNTKAIPANYNINKKILKKSKKKGQLLFFREIT
jgi:sialic acid synthase SpsE